MDEAWLKQAGIRFSARPAVNAYRRGVGYVFSALLMLAERDGFRYAITRDRRG